MKLYYAIGGGLGHLSRANALISTLGLVLEDFIILTNSRFADIVFKKSIIKEVPETFYHKSKDLSEFIQSIICEYGITELYIDTFPNGIIGELSTFNDDSINKIYIARILNWENYLPLMDGLKLRFDKTIVIEELPTVQLEFIGQFSKSAELLELGYPEPKKFENISEIICRFRNPPWLIVHSEPLEELQLLYEHAIEMAGLEKLNPEFLVVSQANDKLKGENIIQLKYFPASDFFPHCEKIFTACGFNSMHQTKPFSNKHYFIPFVRRFDDQFVRAKNRRHSLGEK